MDNQTKASLVNAVDNVTTQALDLGHADQAAVNALYASAYKNIPSGGFPHRDDHRVTYMDQSSVRSATFDGINTITVDEKGTKAHCEDIRDASGTQDLQKIYECMRAVHGSSIAQSINFDDGSGLTMNFQSSNLVFAGANLWQKEAKDVTTYRADASLTMVKKSDGDDGSISISRTLSNGATEHLDMSRTPWYDDKADVKLRAVHIDDAAGHVLKGKSF